jgi:hypothetical protein
MVHRSIDEMNPRASTAAILAEVIIITPGCHIRCALFCVSVSVCVNPLNKGTTRLARTTPAPVPVPRRNRLLGWYSSAVCVNNSHIELIPSMNHAPNRNTNPYRI